MVERLSERGARQRSVQGRIAMCGVAVEEKRRTEKSKSAEVEKLEGGGRGTEGRRTGWWRKR
jgi:hypothetical protein